MMALSLWQPWASLVACGAKRWETRSWSTPKRGLLAIHATAKTPPARGANLLTHDGIRKHLKDPDNLPQGAIVALVKLWNVVPIPSGDRWEVDKAVFRGHETPDLEMLLGWYAAGRYAWELEVVVGPFENPVPCRGRQGLWEVTGDALELLGPALQAAGIVERLERDIGCVRVAQSLRRITAEGHIAGCAAAHPKAPGSCTCGVPS